MGAPVFQGFSSNFLPRLAHSVRRVVSKVVTGRLTDPGRDNLGSNNRRKGIFRSFSFPQPSWCYRFPRVSARLKDCKRRLHFFWRPSNSEFDTILSALCEAIPQRKLCALLGVSTLTLEGWRKHKNGPCASSRRLVWLIWFLQEYPHPLLSDFDYITWGRFFECTWEE